MNGRVRILGIDPGPIPGFVELRYLERRLLDVSVVQASLNAASPVMLALLGELDPKAWATTVQIERFVIGRRSARSSTAAAGEQTRDLVGALSHEAQLLGARVVLKSAANVKPWASDLRLDAAGLLDATKGMRHARDAARHALFAAVHDGNQPDPLSKEFLAS